MFDGGDFGGGGGSHEKVTLIIPAHDNGRRVSQSVLLTMGTTRLLISIWSVLVSWARI